MKGRVKTMGTKIYYSSGNVVELRDGEGARFWNRARNAGFRYYQSLDDVVIPFNHPTITHVELQLDDPHSRQAQQAARKVAKEEPTKPADIKATQKTAAAKQEADFMKKANCTHKDAEGQTLRKLYYSETVNGRKYFPVCDFCGHRERYVGVPKIEEGAHPLWTMEDVRSAKLYEAV
jgi:hypothetical protein